MSGWRRAGLHLAKFLCHRGGQELQPVNQSWILANRFPAGVSLKSCDRSLFPCSRTFASAPLNYDRELEDINNLFVSARDEIEYAKEDSETVYFDQSVAEAKKLVDQVTDSWNSLLSKLPEDERSKLQRSMGLKMEQLKAEYDVVSKLHLED